MFFNLNNYFNFHVIAQNTHKLFVTTLWLTEFLFQFEKYSDSRKKISSIRLFSPLKEIRKKMKIHSVSYTLKIPPHKNIIWFASPFAALFIHLKVFSKIENKKLLFLFTQRYLDDKHRGDCWQRKLSQRFRVKIISTSAT